MWRDGKPHADIALDYTLKSPIPSEMGVVIGHSEVERGKNKEEIPPALYKKAEETVPRTRKAGFLLFLLIALYGSVRGLS